MQQTYITPLVFQHAPKCDEMVKLLKKSVYLASTGVRIHHIFPLLLHTNFHACQEWEINDPPLETSFVFIFLHRH